MFLVFNVVCNEEEECEELLVLVEVEDNNEEEEVDGLFIFKMEIENILCNIYTNNNKIVKL